MNASDRGKSLLVAVAVIVTVSAFLASRESTAQILGGQSIVTVTAFISLGPAAGWILAPRQEHVLSAVWSLLPAPVSGVYGPKRPELYESMIPMDIAMIAAPLLLVWRRRGMRAESIALASAMKTQPPVVVLGAEMEGARAAEEVRLATVGLGPSPRAGRAYDRERGELDLTAVGSVPLDRRQDGQDHRQ